MGRGKSKQNLPGQGSLFDSPNKKVDSSSINQTSGDISVNVSGSNTQINEIVLYPSNWLYNASVIGFLKVVAKGEGEKFVEDMLQEDGSVLIDKSIFDKCFNYYKEYHEKYEGKLYLVGKNKYYPNFLQKIDLSSFDNDYVKKLSNIYESSNPDNVCGICLRSFELPSNLSIDQKYLNRFSNFNIVHNKLLGPSKGEFPNAFWNYNQSFRVCVLCTYLLIHHHLAFISSEGNNQIFINAPSFKLMWYLNKFAEGVISEGGKDFGKILGISLIDLSQRVSATVGAWSLMNIEMVIRKRVKNKKGNIEETIDYYSLPYEIASILLDKEVASLIRQTDEPKVLEKILEGNFDYLLDLNYRIMRCLSNWKGKCDDAYISELELKNRGDKEKLEYLTTLLPLLYVKISQRSITEGRVL